MRTMPGVKVGDEESGIVEEQELAGHKDCKDWAGPGTTLSDPGHCTNKHNNSMGIALPYCISSHMPRLRNFDLEGIHNLS